MEIRGISIPRDVVETLRRSTIIAPREKGAAGVVRLPRGLERFDVLAADKALRELGGRWSGAYDGMLMPEGSAAELLEALEKGEA